MFEPPKAFQLIPESDPTQCRRRRGRRSSLLVRLRRRAHHPPLLSILLTNVQILDNKVEEIKANVAFQRESRDCNILCFTETWLSGDMLFIDYSSVFNTIIPSKLIIKFEDLGLNPTL